MGKPDLAAARAALARYDAPVCGAKFAHVFTDASGCGIESVTRVCRRHIGHPRDGRCDGHSEFGARPPGPEDLRAALAEVDRLTAERDEARADAAELRGGAVGSVHKLRARLAEVEAERDEARRILGELCAESGADTDGADWRHNWRYAAQEVRETWTDLRQDVADLAAERDAAIARADRAERELRCERGEWAPEGPSGAGWTWHPEDWEWTGVAGARSEDEEPINLYVRHRAYWSDEDDQDDNAWAWLVVEQIGQGDEGDTLEAGTAPTALEAIEAAGAAVERARGAR